ncbi:MAG TPA: superoxide dismutase [archaeon]|nr:superoxide dismutase [archaeon]
MVFELPKLGYEYNALEPFIDEKTMMTHHSKHHQGYTDKFNSALQGLGLEGKTAEEIIAELNSIPEEKRTAVKNNGGGYVNHNFFWQCIGPGKGGEPQGELSKAINSSFKSFSSFKEKFSNAAATLFGSGWAWLVSNKGKLEIIQTANQESPLTQGVKPLLTIDVWEHAYYLKYQNRRPEYIENFYNVLNWDFVLEEYKKNL